MYNLYNSIFEYVYNDIYELDLIYNIDLYIIIFLILLVIILSILVVIINNYILSLLFLILAFILAGIYLIYTNILYTGYLIIIIYVGAIAVLFIFIVMMLQIKSNNTYLVKSKKILFYEVLFIFLIIWLIYLIIFFNDFYSEVEEINLLKWEEIFIGTKSSVVTYLANSLYITEDLMLIYLGLILFITLIGTINIIFNKKLVINLC